jgi:hypothetical protein
MVQVFGGSDAKCQLSRRRFYCHMDFTVVRHSATKTGLPRFQEDVVKVTHI